MSFRVEESKGKKVLHIEGATSKDLFTAGALGLCSQLYTVDTVKGGERCKIVMFEKDLEALLSAWLGELLERVQKTDICLTDFRVASIQEAQGGFLLTGEAYREATDRAKHEIREENKKLTLKGTHITEEGKHFSADVILS